MDLSAFEGNALVSSDAFKRMMELNKALSGGGGATSRRISIRGGRFREMVNGEQVNVNSSGSLNVVVLGTSKIGRTYFEGTYDPENPSGPTCWSADSETPAADVPAEKRKAAACRNCPMNIKGSGQGNGRACRFNQRLAVAIEGQYDKVYQLQLPATSLFGDAKDNKYGMQAYARFMDARGFPVSAVVTTAYFDENSETPKLFFKAARPLNDQELVQVEALMNDPDVKKATTLTVYQRDEGEDRAGSKPYNPKSQGFEVDDTPAPKAAEEPVAEPAKRESKPAPMAEPQQLNNLVQAWDDE
jgi:hypothetical protein